MSEHSEALRISVDALLEEGYRLWDAAGLPPLGPKERRAAADAAGALYCGPHPAAFAAACQCYYLFRALHRRAGAFPEAATLLGDYFFSRFSAYLIPLDSAALIRAFSDCLARDAGGADDAGDRTGTGNADGRAGASNADDRAGASGSNCAGGAEWEWEGETEADQLEFITIAWKALRT
jgi:hypothetical protein